MQILSKQSILPCSRLSSFISISRWLTFCRKIPIAIRWRARFDRMSAISSFVEGFSANLAVSQKVGWGDPSDLYLFHIRSSRFRVFIQFLVNIDSSKCALWPSWFSLECGNCCKLQSVWPITIQMSMQCFAILPKAYDAVEQALQSYHAFLPGFMNSLIAKQRDMVLQ